MGKWGGKIYSNTKHRPRLMLWWVSCCHWGTVFNQHTSAQHTGVIEVSYVGPQWKASTTSAIRSTHSSPHVAAAVTPGHEPKTCRRKWRHCAKLRRSCGTLWETQQITSPGDDLYISVNNFHCCTVHSYCSSHLLQCDTDPLWNIKVGHMQ